MLYEVITVERGSTGRVTMPNLSDPFALQQRMDNIGAHRNASDRFYVAAGNGLLIGNDCQGLQQRTRVTWRALLLQAST